VVHTMGGWIGLAAVLLLGPRSNRYRKVRTRRRAFPSWRSVPGSSRSAGSASMS
jgi:ammonia channel protein AmtB